MSSQELTIPRKIRFSPTIEGKDAVNCECRQLLDTYSMSVNVLAVSSTLMLLMHFKLQGELFCHPSQPVTRT